MPTDPINTSGIILLFLTISLLLFVILAFFTLYFCRSMFVSRRNSSAALQPSQTLDEDAPVGLDPSVVASFPTFTYSWVKNLHAGKYGLECAVCLSEFQDDNVLRLLTACSHVFHTDCIDVWLTTHTTCPYCRHELRPQERKSPEVRILVAEATGGRDVEMRRGDEEQQQQRRSVSLFKEEGEEAREGGEEEDEGRRSGDMKRLVRSNSTGHSSIEREDRFTLRLPKGVRERIARERNWTGSCIDFRDLFGDREEAKDEDREIGRSGLSERGCRSRM